MSLLDPITGSDIGRRTATDIILAAATIGTSPWWQGVDINHWLQEFLLIGSSFVLVLRLWGLGKDWWTGRKLRLGDDD